MSARTASPNAGTRAPALGWRGPDEREPVAALLALASVTAFAIAQPIYQLLADNAEFLVAHRVDRLDLFALTLASSAGPALLGSLAVLTVSAASRHAGRMLLCVALAAGVAATLLPPLHRSIAAPGWALVLLAGVAGAGAGLAYARWPGLRSYVSLLALAAVGFPAYFALASPAADAVTKRPDAAAPLLRTSADTPVVFVVFDQLPLFSLLDADEHIDAGRHPSFARLAAQADWFRNGTTVAPLTEMAVPAILTGRYPRTRKLPTWSAHPQNLFTLLGHDYTMNVSQSLTDMCPPPHCADTRPAAPRSHRFVSLLEDVRLLYLHVLLPPDLTASLPDVTRTWRDFEEGGWVSPDATPDDPHASWGDPARVFERFLSGLSSARDGDAPTLHFLHVNLPHVPWKYFPSGTSYGPVGRNLYPYPMNGLTEIGPDDEWALNRALQRHLLQVGYADHLLGRLIDRLEETGLYDRALMIVTADHGISFWPGLSPLDTADTRMASDVMNVPMFVKRPGQREGTIRDDNAEVVDLLPTTLSVLGAAPPEPVDGRSLYDDATPARPGKQLFIDYPDRGIVQVEHARRLGGRRLSQARIERAFGPADDPDRLFIVGPRKDWVRRPLDAFDVRTGSGHRIELDHADAYREVDLTRGILPARVTGEAIGRPAPSQIAIALNGRVEAIVRSYASGDDRARFSAVLPERAFLDGSNSLEVFVVDPRSSEPSLLRAQQDTRAGWQLSEGTGEGPALLRADGTRLPLRAGALEGEVYARGPMMAGWVRSAPGGAEPQAIVVFANGRFHEEQRPRRTRARELARVQNEADGSSSLAFDSVIPFEKLRDRKHPVLRVFVVAHDFASELSYDEAFPYRGPAGVSSAQ